MKIRFGALALMVALAACSSQDQTKTGDTQKGSQASAISSGVGPAIAGYSYDSKRTLGSAPDRGELFSYRKGAAVLHEGAYTLRPIALSEEHAIRAAVTGVMAVPGPDGKDIKIAYERHEEHPDGNWSWIGRVVGGDQAQEAIFTFGQDAVFGSIPQANGPSLKLTTQRGLAYLMQADASRLFHGYRAGNDVKVAAYRPSQGSDDSSDAFVEMAMAKARAAGTAVSPKAFTSANTIDLVAGYSNGLAARLGSDGAAVTRLNQLVVAANQALLNSKVNARIRLVGVVKVDYADNTDNGVALDQLTGNDGENAVTVPAALAPLRTARETTGADLVTLVRDFQQTNNGCGIAWLLGANGGNISPASDSPFGYSIVSDGDYDLNGNTYFCEDISLAHELAHNMGSAHDIGNAGGTPGRFPYSYGYKTTASAGNFFTVMAYGDDNQTLYRVFSNPTITTCGTRACGVANSADNARSLTQTIPVVATFRATVVPIGGAVSDFNGDGLSDILWRNTRSGRNTIWKSANSATEQGVSTLTDLTWKIVGSGDFDGDGITDILWRNSSTGRNSIWKSGNSSKLQAVATVSSPTWKVVGVGDFNNDRKADILWRNSSTGRNSIWLSGNSATQRAVATVDLGYKVAGVGDFNGDGQSDILWRNTNNGRNSVWKSANNKTLLSMTTVADQRWTIVGVGDFDNDGKSDVLWRHTGNGVNSIWRSASSSTVRSVATLADQRWKVAAIGDYNGDGSADILWRHSASGSNSIWRSAAVANVQAVTAVANLDYGVQK